MRLDRFLSRAGVGTRQQVKRILRDGVVTIDGKLCKDAAAQISPTNEIALEDETIPWLESPPFVMLHKPLGYACSHNPAEAPLVAQLLPAHLLADGFEPIGRLDRETSGLLLLTANGDLNHRLTHPKHKIEKEYQVTFTGALPANAVSRVAAGIDLQGDDEPTAPADLTVLDAQHATLILREGRFHQVRRMFAALGVEVTNLHRTRVGGLMLPTTLPPGEFAEGSQADVDTLFGVA